MSIRACIAVILILLGTVVVVISVAGLFRLRDALERIHAAALTDTLGMMLILAGVALLCGLSAHTLKLALLLIIWWATNPVSSHLIARMELITGRDIEPDDMEGEGEQEL